MKTAEFGQPCKAPEPGRCRICGCTRVTACDVPYTETLPVGVTIEGSRACRWTDETQTLCDTPSCVAAARAELTADPAEAERLLLPYEGKRYGVRAAMTARRTINIQDDAIYVEPEGNRCKSPTGDHIFVVGRLKCVYCDAERRPR